MKNLPIFALSLFGVTLCMVFISSCNRSSWVDPISQKSSKNSSKLEKSSEKDFDFYGKLHNEYLSTVHNSFVAPSPLSDSWMDRVDLVKDFLINHTSSISSITQLQQNEINTGLETHKKFLVRDEVFKSVFSVKEGETKNHLLLAVEEAYMNNKIDEWEKNTLTDLALKIEGVVRKTVSEHDCITFIKNKYNEHKTRGYAVGKQFGQASGAVLSIASHSIDWWEATPSAIPPSTDYPIAPCWLNDAAGAMCGFAFSGGSGWGALTGAATASAGAIYAVRVAILIIICG